MQQVQADLSRQAVPNLRALRHIKPEAKQAGAARRRLRLSNHNSRLNTHPFAVPNERLSAYF